ncbi:MAG: alpha-E domain-containing protein [Acidimicrobiales bacterium]|nr:alpha-E domain-containing protein [Acidimicrobiales bacterium]
MLARHAESLFWAGRSIERAESTARMLDVTYHGLLEAMPWEAERSWMDLLKVLWLDRPFAELERGVRAATVSEFLVFDPDNPGAILSSVGQARENSRAARELISSELWEAVNSFHLELRSRNLRADVEARPHELYGFVKRSCQMIAGVAGETMPRDDGWRFLMLGWMLERAEMTCRLLDVRYSQLVTAGATGGFHHWLQTLKSASGSEAFRRRYRASMDPADVVEFLLLSRTFPRSVLFCLASAENGLARLEAGRPTLTRPQRLLGRTRSDLEFLDSHELLEGDLHVFLDQMLNGVRQVAESVALQYFRNAQEHDIHALDPYGPVLELG